MFVRLLTTAALVLTVTGAPKPFVNAKADGLALRGYDAVAYATDGAAVKGSAQYEFVWNNARWRFATADHRDRFAKAPEQFAPQFGGYCAWAVAHGYTADGDPEAWKIVDGKLYLNYSKRVQRMWEQDIPGYIAQAVKNWPAVLEK